MVGREKKKENQELGCGALYTWGKRAFFVISNAQIVHNRADRSKDSLCVELG